MGLISKSKTYSDDEQLNFSDLNQSFDDIVDEVNGNLDDNNIDSVGIAKITNPYKFHAYMSAGQSMTSGAGKTIKFNAERFDTNGNFDVNAYKYTVPVTGYYFLSAKAYSYRGGSAGITKVDWRINKNGTVMDGILDEWTDGSTSRFFPTLSGVYYLSAGDEITVYGALTATSSVALEFNNAYSAFCGHLISV